MRLVRQVRVLVSIIVFVTITAWSRRGMSTWCRKLTPTMSSSTDACPRSPAKDTKAFFANAGRAIKYLAPAFVAAGAVSSASAMTASDLKLPGTLGDAAYTTLGTMPMCRILNGMWQVSGAHGFTPVREKVVAKMAEYADAGLTTFDLADIYGPAEDYVGSFSRGPIRSSLAQDCQFFTKWVPRPQSTITRKEVESAIDRSLERMKRDSVDLLQFHWWEYENHYYLEALAGLMYLQQKEKIRNLGLCNFDTKHLSLCLEQEAPIVSNQVSYSTLDTRPAELMTPVCLENNVQLLCYGTLLGGFLSSFWLGKSEPRLEAELTNISLRKYLPWIELWGGWALFQELLRTLQSIAQKHNVSLSTIALRWVLDQPAVGGVIVGVRFGLRDHIADNIKLFQVQLDEEDRARIQDVQSKARNKGRALMLTLGDCGGEYRRRQR